MAEEAEGHKKRPRKEPAAWWSGLVEQLLALAHFAFRVVNALARIGAMALFLEAHHVLLDGRILALFGQDTAMWSVIHGATTAAFGAVYFTLLLDMIIVFVRGFGTD